MRAALFFFLTILVGCAATPSLSAAAEDTSDEDLTRLSLGELSKVDVTSVSKSSEKLQLAPASIYVISHDDILRSGARHLPEILRLAPNLLITQLTATSYEVSARGLGGDPRVQNFSNKLLILVDGRSVYSPLFSGVYTDAIDVLPEDVERVEVISGPGATLWGANAMNGVINIVTRSAYLTEGGYAGAVAGNQEQSIGARYGAKTADGAAYRVYGTEFHRGAMQSTDGSAHDGWSKGQGGFRVDWSEDRNAATVQGDFYRGTESQTGSADMFILGGNLLGRYQHRGERSDLQIQAYLDQSERVGPAGTGGTILHTYDIEIQQNFALSASQHLVWGAGERLNLYSIDDAASLLFQPHARSLSLGDVFLQDTISVSRDLNLTAGLKMEDDPFSGWTALPDLRAALRLTERAALWASASRAIRSPTPFDRDVIEKVGQQVFLTGNESFRPERVATYEIGSRLEMQAAVSVSVAAFYNVYDDLRSIETASASVFLPLRWGNMLRGHTQGVEAWSDWEVTDWWRLSPGVTFLRKDLEFKSGASQLLGVGQSGDDPQTHATLRSSMEWIRGISFDATLRYVGALPDPAIKSYYEMDARLAWRATSSLDLSISATNLLHARHEEFPAPEGEVITRSVMGQVNWRF